MWITSVIQSCSSFTPRENWLCSATILSSLDTFSWKRQTWVSHCPFHRDLRAWSYSNWQASHLVQITRIGHRLIPCTDRMPICINLRDVWTLSSKNVRIIGSKAEKLQFTVPKLSCYSSWWKLWFIFFQTESVQLLPIASSGRPIKVVSSFHIITFGSTDTTWPTLLARVLKK